MFLFIELLKIFRVCSILLIFGVYLPNVAMAERCFNLPAVAVTRTVGLTRRLIAMDVMEVIPTVTGHQAFLINTEDINVHNNSIYIRISYVLVDS